MDTAKGRVTVLFLSFVSENWRKFLFPVAAIAVIIVFLLIPRGQAGNESIVISEQNPFPELIDDEPEEVSEPVTTPAMIVVDVKGAVRHPGVYPMQGGDRLIDAINAAGGYVPEADSRLLNHAIKITDELLIYVPLVGEELPEGGTDLLTSGNSEANDDGIVNINTASESELMTISGIGPAKATAIIQFRNEQGPFSAPESLMEISGIGQKTFEKLEHQIKVK